MNPADRQAILWAMEAFAEAWSSGDAWLAASFCAEDCVRFGPAGDVQHGRPAVEGVYDQLFHDKMRGAKVRFGLATVTELGRDMAEWQADLVILNATGAPGWQGQLVQVMVKVDGRWLVAVSRPEYAPVKPGEPMRV